MNSSSSNVEALAEGIQTLRLAEKHQSNLTPPPSEYSQKSSQKSTSNHSDHHHDAAQQYKNAYIESLKEEREQLGQCSDGFNHVFALIDREIKKLGGGDLANHKVVVSSNRGELLSETLRVPVDEYPEYNFVGRILGPRGSTARQLEDTTGCRVTIHGRPKKEAGASDPGPLRIQISVPADAPDAARRLETGVAVVKKLLVPPTDGQDELKRQQLMILATIKGTYRPDGKAPAPYSAAGGDYSQHMQS
uniref:KH domain-containing protein n=1 Tax=Caenorhabditis tropicalis TaxID=1561998 RepID=A0A1I7V0S0_9PELO